MTDLYWELQPACDEELVSIVIPSHNRRDYLQNALASAFAQSYRPIEVVIVDDGSTDGTCESVAAWVSEHPTHTDFSVRVLSQENQGAQRSRNAGILAVRGAYIQFLDADDTLDPEKVRLQVAHLRLNPGLEMSIGQTCSMAEPDRSLHAHRAYDHIEFLCRSVSWSPVSTLGPLLRRGVLAHPLAAWDERLPCCQDWEYFTRLILCGATYGYCLAAKAYIRPDDGRVRTGTHVAADRGPAYLSARRIQLQSMWAHAPRSIRACDRFRQTLAWEMLRLHGWFGTAGHVDAARDMAAAAAAIAGRTRLGALSRPVRLLGDAGLVGLSAPTFSLIAWCYYRQRGLANRFRRLLRGR